MGARGPLKLPPHLAPVPDAGDPDTAATRVQPVAPEKPKAIADDAELSQLWDQLVPELDKDGLLSRSDVLALELALRHFQAARKASTELQAEGMSITDHGHGGKKKNPLEAIFRAESAMFLRYGQQLGMTFAGRARTPTKDTDGGEGSDENPFAQPAV